MGEKLYILDLAKGPTSLRTIDTGISIGVTADIEGSDEVILAGAKDGITKFNVQRGQHEYLAKFWNEGDGPDKAKEYVAKALMKTSLLNSGGRMRSNDGAADSKGRYWVGTMNDPLLKEPEDPGVVFRLDTDGTLHRVIEKGPVTPNGISWNEKNDTMYLTDSPENNILAFDFDVESGAISNKRVFFHNNEESNIDGHVRDVEDCIWHACYGGSKVIRISPEGQVIGEISLPTRNVTCPAFVGTELFVTSAKEDETEKNPELGEIRRQSLQGGRWH